MTAIIKDPELVDVNTDKCEPGYRCLYQATGPQDTICQAGSYCNEGSSFEIPCPPGKACTAPATY
jgi:hypothetical protein